MAGYYQIGEEKDRPGAYFHVDKDGDDSDSGIVSGVTGAVFASDFGPLNEAVVLDASEGYDWLYGNGGKTDIMSYAIKGGARTIVACRAGSGGTAATVTLKGKVADAAEADSITITPIYVGTRPFEVTIREKLADPTYKQAVFFSNSEEVCTVDFLAGAGEAQALADALAGNEIFRGTVAEGQGQAVLTAVSQKAFTAGTNPTITNQSYSDAFQKIEAYALNTVCVDSEDATVHALLVSFVERAYEDGNLCIGVIAEAPTVALDTRISHAAAFNSEKMVYVVNPYIKVAGEDQKGYKVAARIAGLIGAVPSTSSITHYLLNGVDELGENMSNRKIKQALKSGCLILSLNTKNQVQVEKGITTLVTPPADRDKGWKKIRRTKTRFELLRRCNAKADNLCAKIDNDPNGRKTLIGAYNDVGEEMVGEGKITAYQFFEDPNKKADGDYAYFRAGIIDKDSLEYIYTDFHFQFSVNE